MLWFYVLLVPHFKAYGEILYANLGDNVTLTCFFSATHLSWYKQEAGEQPQIISTFYKHSSNSNIFYKEFKDNKRLSVQTAEGFYNLSISNVQDSDSAMYYCGYTSISITVFDKGTFLLIKNYSCRSFLHQPEFDSVQLGGSATLNCTVRTGTSDGEHGVYWFKKDSEMSHMGVLYTNTKSSCQYETSSGSAAHSCVYSLSMRNMRLPDAGMYHCAVASCGQILFGTGTRLSVEGNQWEGVLVHGVAAALVLSLILNIIQFSIFYYRSRRKYLYSEGSHPQPENPVHTEKEESSAMQYAALHFKQREDPSNTQRTVEEDTVYSRVRCPNFK